MSGLIKFKIITPEKVIYQDDILMLSLTTESGEITIYPNHAPLVTLAKVGELRLHKQNSPGPIPLAISSGIVEVRPSSEKHHQPTEVIVLVGRSELATDIDLERAKQAYDRAVKLAEEKGKINDVDFARFADLIEKEANRIKVYNKWRK